MVIGWLYIKQDWRLDFFKSQVKKKKRKQTLRKIEEAEEEIRDAPAEIDRILDKINRVGYDQLDEDEKELLFRASRDLSDDENKRN
jgi:hypothetical protein